MKMQHGQCDHCGLRFRSEDGLEVHHRDGHHHNHHYQNLALLHAHYHHIVHRFAAKFTFASPDDIATLLADIALLTGGRPVLSAAGQSLNRVQTEDLGAARRVWASKDHFGIFGGKGDPKLVREFQATLRSGLDKVTKQPEREGLRDRLAKLTNGSATLKVGGSTKADIETRLDLAKRVAQVLRRTVRQGIIPGGGISLWACRPLLSHHRDASQSVEERAAYTILHKAFAAPAQRLLTNAGLDAGEAIVQLELLSLNNVYDVDKRQIVDWREAGIFDSSKVIKNVVQAAVSSAALALTIDVLVHVKKPRKAYDGP